MKAVAYARVSTLLGQNPDNQLSGIRELAQSRGFDLVSEYVDIGISGTHASRPSLDEMVKKARLGQFKVIIVYSLDRLARSTLNMLKLLDELNHYKVSIISIREGLDFSTPTGQMVLTVMAAVAQLESQITGERIATALALKKRLAIEAGIEWKCGRPSTAKDKRDEILKLRKRGISIRAIAESVGVSKSSVARVVKEGDK